jgi:hypothetical protein
MAYLMTPSLADSVSLDGLFKNIFVCLVLKLATLKIKIKNGEKVKGTVRPD